jgi:hypothetical protein
VIAALILLQAIEPLPDLEFHAAVRARSLTIEKNGDARLTVTTDPTGRNVADIQAPKAQGRRTIANPVITIHVEARIADPAAAAPPPE